MNYLNIRKLIKDTLNAMDHPDPITMTDINLVEMTFIGETDVERIYEIDGAPRHGLMGVTRNRFETAILNDLRVNEKAISNFNNLALVDIENDTLDDLWEAAAYNLAFQILFTFYFYYTNSNDLPSNVTEASRVYCSIWKQEPPDTNIIKKFIEYDKRLKESVRG